MLSPTANQECLVDSAASAPVSVIVPCFNELPSLDRLAQELTRLEVEMAGKAHFEFLLVDDGSTDGTGAALQARFADHPHYLILSHKRNLGIAAAIQTGLRAATGEIAASIDADCSYDPLQLAQMLPLLTADVDLVVASPYHPLGKVNNVPTWRLALSKAASGLYRLALRHKLHTYTSCFRVYRRSAAAGIQLTNPGFVGVAELVWRMDRQGYRIVECPAELDIRRTGQSKMRVLRAAGSHLRLLGRALLDRWLPASRAAPRPIADYSPSPAGKN